MKDVKELKTGKNVFRVRICVNDSGVHAIDAEKTSYEHFIGCVQYKRLLCSEYDDMFILYVSSANIEEAFIDGMRMFFSVLNNEHVLYPYLRTNCVCDDVGFVHTPVYDMNTHDIVLLECEHLLEDYERIVRYKRL